MQIETLQIIALKKLSIAKIMKAESFEKEVISRLFVQIESDGEETTSSFRGALREAQNHPCKMDEYRVWHSNWCRNSKGVIKVHKPLKFRGRFTCKCSCDGNGAVCNCNCAAVIKMAAEFKMRSVYKSQKTPTSRCRLNQADLIEDILST